LQSRVSNGQFSAQSLVWGPGIEQWINLQNWKQDLTNLGPSAEPESPVEAWHFAVAGQSKGPLSRENLIGQLKGLNGVGEVMIWTKGMKEWAPLYEFHDLLSEVGINKRQFPRAELDGKAILRGESTTVIAPLLSISEGGFGVTLGNGVSSGEVMTVELQSPSFREPLHCKAEVRYIGQGVMGFKFTTINMEAKGVIIQFIRQTQMRFPIRAA
jgi:hypothetical protein